jgi:kynurenine formamidase
MTPTNFEHLAETVRNWGRWGVEDQRGTVNHIGPEALKAAAAAVQSGKLFSLGINFDKNGPQVGPERFNPMLYMTHLFSIINPAFPSARHTDDIIVMPSQCATQWDALGHIHYDGLLYNGCKACDTLSPKGAARLGIQNLAQPGIMSRGILLDIARLKKVERLPLDYAISVDDLNEACATQGVKPQTGDIVLIRTGHIQYFTIDKDRATFNGWQSGITHHSAEWAHDHSLAAICADNVAVELMSPEVFALEMPMPFHMLAIRDMGMPLGEIFNLEALAADCAADGRYAFMLAAPPLAVTNAVGSPVNPLALK